MAVAIFNGVIGMISPEGDVKKYIRFLGALCLLCAMVSPIYSAFAENDFELDSIFSVEGEDEVDYEQIYSSSLAEGSRDAARDALKAKIMQEFELDAESFDVEIELSEAADKAIGVRVELHSSAVFADPRDIAAFVNETAECSCTVIYDIYD